MSTLWYFYSSPINVFVLWLSGYVSEFYAGCCRNIKQFGQKRQYPKYLKCSPIRHHTYTRISNFRYFWFCQNGSMFLYFYLGGSVAEHWLAVIIFRYIFKCFVNVQIYEYLRLQKQFLSNLTNYIYCKAHLKSLHVCFNCLLFSRYFTYTQIRMLLRRKRFCQIRS